MKDILPENQFYVKELDQNRAEFIKHFLYDIYRLMPAYFKKATHLPSIIQGAVDENIGLDVKSVLDLARYYFGRDGNKYNKYIGILFRTVLDRYDPLTCIKPVEDVSDELYAYYWHQMNDAKSRIMYSGQDIAKFELEKIDSVIYAHDLICMDIGRTILGKFTSSNGLPLAIGELSLAYSYIGNFVTYVWVISQLQVIQEADIDPEILEKINRGEL